MSFEVTIEDRLRRLKRELAMERLDFRVKIEAFDETAELVISDKRKELASHVISAARSEWELGVEEPPSETFHRIDEYIRGELGLNWTWEEKYTRNRQFAWCGAFAAFVYGKAGLKYQIRYKRMASRIRLYKWAEERSRFVHPDKAEPGDVLVVGPDGSEPYGSHITIIRSRDGGSFVTYEGNAKGAGLSGQVYEGVITRRRPLRSDNEDEYRHMYIVHFELEDFEL